MECTDTRRRRGAPRCAFALDSVREGVGPFLIHAAPSLLLLAVVAISWRHEWVAGVVFVAAAAFYAFTTRRMDWVLLISGPLFVVGMLYLWSWRRTQPPQKRSPDASRA